MREVLGSGILEAKELPGDNTVNSGSEIRVNRGPVFSLRPTKSHARPAEEYTGIPIVSCKRSWARKSIFTVLRRM
jgi:hypothetical protein